MEILAREDEIKGGKSSSLAQCDQTSPKISTHFEHSPCKHTTNIDLERAICQSIIPFEPGAKLLKNYICSTLA